MLPVWLQLKDFQLLLGSLDITKNLLQWRDNLPATEITTTQSRTGSFTLKYSMFADRTEAELDDQISRSLWDRGQQELKLYIEGNLYFTGFILLYRYSPRDQIGSGSFGDRIALQRSIQISKEVPDITIGTGTQVSGVVTSLILESGRRAGNQIYSDVIIPHLTGSLGVPLVTRDPIPEAQKYLGVDRFFLYCNKTGQIRAKQFPSSFQPTFSASIEECLTYEPDLTGDYYRFDSLMVTGSHEIAKATPPSERVSDPDTADDANQPTLTETYGTKVSVNPEEISNKFQRIKIADKKIEYLQGSVINVGGGSTIPTVKTTIRKAAVTFLLDFLERNAQGQILGESAYELLPAEITEESATSKKKQLPFGLVAPDAITGTGLIALNQAKQLLESEETITQLSPSIENTAAEIEPPSPPTPFQAETVAVNGRAEIATIGYARYLDFDDIREIGYLYSNGQANLLAAMLLNYETGKANSFLIELPPPKEWLLNPEPFVVCHVHDCAFVMDAPSLSIDANNGAGQCKLTFAGIKYGTITRIPAPPIPPLYFPQVGLHIVPIANLGLLKDVSIASIQMQAIGGALPYSWSGSLPAGLSISSGGLISGSPTTAQSSTSHTLTVTDNLSISADFIIQISILAASIPVPFVAEILVLSETLVDASFIQIIDVGITDFLDTQMSLAVFNTVDFFEYISEYFTNLQALQLRFQSFSGVTVSGSEVIGWVDQKASRTASTNLPDKPALLLSDLNGLDVIEFVGGADRRLILTGAGNVLRNKTGGTIYAVFNTNDLTTNQSLIFIRTASGGGDNSRFSIGINQTAGEFYFGGRRLDSDDFQSVSGGTATVGDWVILTAVMDYINRTLSLRVNGVEVASTSSFQSSGNSEDTASNAITIGSHDDSFRLDGKIFFLGVCDQAHDLATRQRTERVLSTITGITI